MSLDVSTHSRSDLPAEVRGWNWGAFLLNWIWGLGNGTAFGLLMFVPLVNFVIPFVMGAKGNRWAWENRKWQNVAQFKRAQRIWSWVGLGFWGSLLGVFFLVFFVAQSGMKKSEVYELSLLELNKSQTVAEILGRPVQGESPRGRILDSGRDGTASMSYEVQGPKGRGMAFFDGHKSSGRWILDAVQLEVEATGQRFDILQPGPGDNRSP
ncbi:MAG: hypothetical protein IPN71_03190 [Fibrobacteres bacterium]|nr:hypothetical protein [Fibrobacterota bacterium]